MKKESTMIEKETVVAMSKVAQKISQARFRLLPLDLVEVKELLDDCQEIMATHCDCAPAQLIEGQVDIIMVNQEEATDVGEEEATDVGEGWREIEPGETLCDGDQFMGLSAGVWFDTSRAGDVLPVPLPPPRYRRRVTRKKYLVDVCRTSYGVKTLEIEANSPEEAQELALDQAGNHEYSEKESEYTCQGCISSSRALDALSVSLKEQPPGG